MAIRQPAPGVKIGMVMPRKLNPGPWVSQITFAAPVSLFLFFFVVFVLTTVKKIRLHPMNYFFIGAAFFSFHLLLAYLVDHVSIHVSFLICSLVSIALVVSYLRLAVGNRFAFIEAAFCNSSTWYCSPTRFSSNASPALRSRFFAFSRSLS